MSVVRLVDKAPGFSMADVSELCGWLRDWADYLEKPGSWVPRSAVLVVESDNGGIAAFAQSLEQMDKARLVGLLQMAAVRKINGGANLEDLGP